MTFDVPKGSVTTVLGANGAGQVVAGRGDRRRGEAPIRLIEFDGVDITGIPAHKVSKRGISYVPESRNLFPNLTVRDNLWAQLRFTLPRAERKDAFERALELFPILAERRNQKAGTLSGGEQQMLALSRVLAEPPQLLIADEMSLGLAPLMVDLVFESLAKIRDEGVTVLLIEQFVDARSGSPTRR